MSASLAIKLASRLGVKLALRDGRIVATPKGAATQELRELAKAHKPGLIVLLTKRSELPPTPKATSSEIPLPTAEQQKATLKCFADGAIAPVVREAAKEELQKIAAKEVPAASDSETPQLPSTPTPDPELRAAVLRQLAGHPETTSALVITDTSTDPVIVGYGIRGKATCELAIPKGKFNAEELQRAFPDTSMSLAGAVADTVEVFSQPPKQPPNDGLSPAAREALGIIRKLARGKGPLDALAVANAMQVSVTALFGALAELEGKRLIAPGDWTRCGTKIKLVTH